MFKALKDWRYRFWLWRTKPPRCARCGAYFTLGTPAYTRIHEGREQEVCADCATIITVAGRERRE